MKTNTFIIEQYLNELFGNKNSNKIIKEVKDRIKKIEKEYWNGISILGKSVNFLYDKIEEEVLTKEKYSKDSIAGRDEIDKEIIIKKHKTFIQKRIKEHSIVVNKIIPKLKNSWKSQLKLINDLENIIKNNKEAIDSIKIRWYNIFGGDINRILKEKIELEKALKLSNRDIIDWALQPKYYINFTRNEKLDDLYSERIWRHIVWNY